MNIFKYSLFFVFLILLSGCASYPVGNYYVDYSNIPAAKRAYRKEKAKLIRQKRAEKIRIAKCVAKNQARRDEGMSPQYDCSRSYNYNNSYGYNYNNYGYGYYPGYYGYYGYGYNYYYRY